MHWLTWVKPPLGFKPGSPAWEADDLPTELSLHPFQCDWNSANFVEKCSLFSKSHTKQLETFVGNHCCLMTIVYGRCKWCYRIKDWFIHLLILSLTCILVYSLPLYLCINMINKKHLYANQISSRWKKVENETFYCHSCFKYCTEKNVVQRLIIFLLILFQYMSTL